ncbi:UNVERIFIED_CONTAM: hypothetical protein NCL1_31477 [Trichonephila clavipes]
MLLGLLATGTLKVNDAQNYLQTEGLNIHQCVQTDLKRTMFSSTDGVTPEIRERFQNLTVAESSAKICFFKA